MGFRRQLYPILICLTKNCRYVVFSLCNSAPFEYNVIAEKEGDNIVYQLLGAHVNTTLNGLEQVLAQWKPPLVVVLDHSDLWHRFKATSPSTVLVGRLVEPLEANFNEPTLDPEAAARRHCDKVLPFAERMGRSYTYWQGFNEPVIQSFEAMRRLADFEVERARIMDSHGFRVVVGSFSVGNPSRLAWWRSFLPALEVARQLKGALALHEYAWPTLDRESPWYLLRHRKVYYGEPEHDWEGLPAHLRTLPLAITECGLDGLIERGDLPRGWKTLYGQDPDRYLQQLAWYDAELAKDRYVIGAALYCCCQADDPNWAAYNIWPGVVQALARQARPVYRLEHPIAPDEPPIKPQVPPSAPPSRLRPSQTPNPGETPGVQPSPVLPPPASKPQAPPGVQPPPTQSALPSNPPRRAMRPGPHAQRPLPLPLSMGSSGRVQEPNPQRISFLSSSAPAASAPFSVPQVGQAMLAQALKRLDRVLALSRAGFTPAPETEAQGGTAVDKPRVLDQQGQELEWDWLVANLGAVTVERAEPVKDTKQIYRLLRVQAVEGPAALVVHVAGEDGNPREGVTVVRHWADAPVLPAWPAPASRWHDRGVYGRTDVRGNLGFGLGTADQYSLPNGGPSAVWLADPAGPSDLIAGLGMVQGTDHRHLDLFWLLEAAPERVPVPPASPPAAPNEAPPAPLPPSPPLAEDQWALLIKRLDAIIDVLEQRVGPEEPGEGTGLA